MDVKSVKLIYFSPTGTTQKIVASVADGFGSDNVEHLDLTLHENIQHSFRHSSDELVIIGAPVTAVVWRQRLSKGSGRRRLTKLLLFS